MKYPAIYLLIFSALTLSFCSSKNSDKKEWHEQLTEQPGEASVGKGEASVEIKAPSLANQQIILSKVTQRELVAIDTINTDAAGKGQMKKFIREKCFAIIRFNDNQNIFFYLDTTSHISISVISVNPLQYEISGNKESEELRELSLLNAGFAIKLKAKQAAFSQNTMMNDMDRMNAEKEMNTLIGEATTSMRTQAMKSKSPYTKVFAVELLNVTLPGGDELKLAEEVKKLPPFEWFSVFLGKTEARTKTAEGAPAPEISLADTTGNIKPLSSLKGKYVMIDFWASWCGPCRRENPFVVQLYEKYKNKGFEIYGVSLDRDMASWKKAINADGIKWVQVSDLKYWQSVAAKAYGVSSIPFTVLLDKQGKIIATGLRGAALEQKLAQLMP